VDNRKILSNLLKYDTDLYENLHQRIIDDQGVPMFGKKDYEIFDMDVIRVKMDMAEYQDVKDDNESLRGESSVTRKRKRTRIDSQSDASKASAGKVSQKNIKKR
jgi:hypothetical protein